MGRFDLLGIIVGLEGMGVEKRATGVGSGVGIRVYPSPLSSIVEGRDVG